MFLFFWVLLAHGPPGIGPLPLLAHGPSGTLPLRATWGLWHVASCILLDAYCLLPIAYCLLPAACCLSPVVYCSSPIAYCLLPDAYVCLLVGAHVLGVTGEALVLFRCGGGSHGSSPNVFSFVGLGVRRQSQRSNFVVQRKTTDPVVHGPC